MTPKEKTEELLWKFNPDGVYWDIDHVWIGSSKSPEIIKKGIAMSCKRPLLIAIDEILDALKIDLDKDLSTIDVAEFVSNKIIYWQEVKQEIEKL
jgi:hypothetical protein